MDSLIKRELNTYLLEQNISVAELERRAGLKTNAVRNILIGRSRNPGGQTLKAIANVLNRPIDQLLDKIENAESDKSSTVQNFDLFSNTVENIIKVLKSKHQEVTIEQLFFLIKEVYSFSLTRQSKTVDSAFIEWVLNRSSVISINSQNKGI